jgi:hypothetical protein
MPGALARGFAAAVRKTSAVIPEPDVALVTKPRITRRRVVVLGTAGVVVLAALSLFLEVRWHMPQSYAGDEPHYLVITNSLIEDGDFDVKNDYLDQRYMKYYPFEIDPHVNTNIFKPSSPHWYSEHGVGLPVLLLPAVVIGDERGGVDEMVGLAVVVLVLAFFWVRRFVPNPWLAGIAVGSLGLSPFFLGVEGRIFPDLLLAGLLLGALLILEQPERREWKLGLLSVLVGVSPWVHSKYLLALGTVLAIVAVQVGRSTQARNRVRRLFLLVVPALASVVAYELVTKAWYGTWIPTPFGLPGHKLFALSEPRGFSAVSFDSARGLFPNAPAMLLILVGLPLWHARFRGPLMRLALVIGPSILIDATYSDWSGGFAPPARYAIGFVPALVPAIALVLRDAPRTFRVVAWALLAINAALAAAFVWLRPPWDLTGTRSPFFAAIQRHLGPTFDHAFPAFDYWGNVTGRRLQLAVWIGLSALFLGVGVFVARRQSASPETAA